MTYNVGIFLFNQAELMDFAGPYEVFSSTYETCTDKPYNVFSIAETKDEIITINGMAMLPEYSFSDHPSVDILVLPGGVGSRKAMKKDPVIQWLLDTHAQCQITVSVCTGAMLLAKAGLLKGQKATTHHTNLEELKQLSPDTIIDTESRFVDNGKIMTGGGISAGIDISLYVVSKLHNQAMADDIAVYMEYGDWRSLR